MTDPREKPEFDSLDAVRAQLVEAALPHVAFDGWTEATWRAAVADSGVDPVLASVACPRGGIDLARAFHLICDARMAEALAARDLSAIRFRDRVALAVRLRLEAAGDRETVRRGMTLFSLPSHAAEGTGLVWGTADAIWRALGDTSTDLNWYSKRATLSGVFAATTLYWLGDDSAGSTATWEFLDRRIDGVMRVEKIKAGIRKTPVLRRLMAVQDRVAACVKAPAPRDDLPGRAV